MKIYEFTLKNFGEPKLGLEEYDVEEKAKTYVAKYRKFNKRDIDNVIGYKYDTVLLLENNPSVAAKLLFEIKNIEYNRLQVKLKQKDDEIKMLLKYM